MDQVTVIIGAGYIIYSIAWSYIACICFRINNANFFIQYDVIINHEFDVIGEIIAVCKCPGTIRNVRGSAGQFTCRNIVYFCHCSNCRISTGKSSNRVRIIGCLWTIILGRSDLVGAEFGVRVVPIVSYRDLVAFSDIFDEVNIPAAETFTDCRVAGGSFGCSCSQPESIAFK